MFLIPAPLNAHLDQSELLVDLGHSLTLNCNVSGGPIKAVEWMHNGHPISSISGGSSLPVHVRLLSRDVLYIERLARSDQGLYQCLAYNDFDSAQAQVQVVLGGEKIINMKLSLKRHERDLGIPNVVDLHRNAFSSRVVHVASYII